LYNPLAGTATKEQMRDHNKNMRRQEEQNDTTFHSRADLHNWMQDNVMPDDLEDFTPFKMYAVAALAEEWQRYPDTLACVLVTSLNVKWIGQLLQLGLPWTLHGDGTHKIHIGRWILMTFGTHCLRWDSTHKVQGTM
jgi:hypothetical protein